MLAGAVTAVLAVAFALPAVASSRVDHNVHVTDIGQPTRSYESPLLAAQGSRLLLAGDDYSRESCQVWGSDDLGASWERRTDPTITDRDDCGEINASILGPRGLAVSQDGTILHALRAANPGGAQTDVVLRSSDGGRSWEEVLVTAGSSADVTFAADGSAYVGWRENGALLIARSTDGGRSFEAPVVAVTSDLRPSVGRGWLRAGPAGDVYAFYIDGSARDPVFGFAGPASIGVARSHDRGTTWESTVAAVIPPTASLGVTQPVGAVDDVTGAVVVAWSDARNGAVTGPADTINLVGRDRDVFLARSTDQGATWQAAVRLNDDPVGNGAIQYRPAAAAGGGNVHVAWYDYRHDPARGNGPETADQAGLADVYLAVSTDAGASFERNRRVTDRPINRFLGIWSRNFIQAPPSLAVTPEGVGVAWSDTSLGDVVSDAQDLRVAHVTTHAPGRGERTTVPLAGSDEGVALSRFTFPGGGSIGQADGARAGPTVVVAPSDDLTVAVVATALARNRGASLLLADSDGLADDVTAEVARLRTTRAYLVGDEALLGAQVESDLRASGVDDIERIAGGDRYATAAAVAAFVAPVPSWHPGTDDPGGQAGDNTAVIVLGEHPDPAALREATAAAGIAPALHLPVLLVTSDGVPEATRRAIADRDIRHTLVVASPGRIPDAVVEQLPDPMRLSGADAAATAAAVADELLARGGARNAAYLTAVEDPAAALLTGSAAGRLGGVTLLVACDALSAGESEWLVAHAAELDRIVTVAPDCARVDAAPAPTGAAGQPPGGALPATGGGGALVGAALLLATLARRRR